MRKGFLAVAVLASAALFACPKPKPPPEPLLEPASEGLQAGGSKAPGCTTACQEGSATGCTVYVESTQDGGKKFKPDPNAGWSMCPGQMFVLESQTNKDSCVDLRTMNGEPVARGDLAGRAMWSSPPLDGGAYCVSVCWDKDKNDAGCSAGCKHSDCKQGIEDTIRGNLDVIVKESESLHGPRDAGTP